LKDNCRQTKQITGRKLDQRENDLTMNWQLTTNDLARFDSLSEVDRKYNQPQSTYNTPPKNHTSEYRELGVRDGTFNLFKIFISMKELQFIRISSMMCSCPSSDSIVGTD